MQIEYSKKATKYINALEFIRKLVIAWDPDFTKLTPAEKKSLEEALADPETIPHDAINWD